MSKSRELDRFEQAKAALDLALEPLQSLIDEYNASLEQANAVVRSSGITTEDFKVSREYDEYDAEKLFELVGREKFLEWGGIENVRRELDIDKVKLKSFISANKVPPGVVALIATHKRQYSAPKPLKIA